MKLKDFKTEQWMNIYETKAVYNMTDTCVQPLSFSQLKEFDNQNQLDNIILDYGTITGDVGLKQEILKLYRSGTNEQITMTNGCLEANQHVMDTLLEPEDAVIVFTPGYQQFYDYPKSLGCHVIYVPLLEEKQWEMDVDAFDVAMQQKIKMIIINQPSNPTGSLFSKDVLEHMIALARKQNTWILSDEVYQGIQEDEVAMSDIYEYGISTCSLSKVFSLAGLRIGWIKANQEVIDRINVRRDYTMISTGALIDTLAKIALENKEVLLKRSKSIIRKNQEILNEWLTSHPKFSIVMPSSGTVGFLKYTYPMDSETLAKNLLKDTGVFFVPGSCFECEYHLRIGFTAEHDKFIKGLDLLEEWLERQTFA